VVVVFRDRPVGRACTTLVAGVAAFSLAFGGTAANAEEPGSEGVALEAVLSDVAPETLENVADVEVGDSAVSYTQNGLSAEVSLDASEGITFASEGGEVGLQLPFGDEAKIADSSTPGIVVFDNGNGSKSAAVVNDDSGVQVNTVIDGEEAPSRYDYHARLPEGATLRLNDDGSVDSVGASSEEAPTLHIAPPWAKDADGKNVPTRYEISGSTITQVVEHSAINQYPIVADPATYVDYNTYKIVNRVGRGLDATWQHKTGCTSTVKIPTCTAKVDISVSSTVQASFSLSAGWVAGQLGYSLSQVYSYGAACTRTTPGRVDVYAQATTETYQIEKTRHYGVPIVGKKLKTEVTKSSSLTAKVPNRRFSCL